MPREVEHREGGLILAIGATLAGLGVAAGAFGAHLLKARLGSDGLDIWRTAAQYQMYHALALLIVARLLTRHPSRLLRASCWLFVVGTVLFSGSLYLLAFTGTAVLGAVTPVGGMLLLAGWAALAVGAFRTGHA